MFTIHKAKGDKIIAGELNDFQKKNVVWAECQNPSLIDLEKISEASNIPIAELKSHRSSSERPKTYEYENFSLVVFAAPQVEKEKRPAAVALFIVDNKNIITITTRKIAALEKVKANMAQTPKKYFESSTRFLRLLLENIVDDYFGFFDSFQEEADKLENFIFKKPDDSAVKRVFVLKKTLLYYHKRLVANREVISAIEKSYLSRVPKKELHEFRDIYNDLVQLIDTEETLRDILTGIIEIYMSSVSNNMNQVIKKLTLVASYIMIPTLIASIYGMNFKNMPELLWKYGYAFAMGLMVISVIFMYIYFKKGKCLD